jgi:Leucine-rich repeat (LRR) protein
MKELTEFLDKHKVEYKVENAVKNGRVICDIVYVDLSNRGITELPKDIGKLDCKLLFLDSNNITELPPTIGDIRCRWLRLHDNPIPKHQIKYLDRIENLKNVSTDYSEDLEENKQLCIVNSRKDKIKSILE